MEFFGKIRNKFRNDRFLTERSEKRQDNNDDRAFYDEEIRPSSKLWLCLLFISSTVIITKYLVDYGLSYSTIYKNILGANYNIINLFCDTLSKTSDYIWASISLFQWILYPTIFAAAFVTFSWIVLYKDSNIPGINPPTPFSPPRYRTECVRSMDFPYALTGTFGLLIFVRLLYQYVRDSD